MSHPRTGIEPDLELHVEAGPAPDSAYIFVSPSAMDDLVGILKSSSIRFAPAAFATAEVYLAAITALLGAQGLSGLEPVITAFVQRNKEKSVKVKVGDIELDVNGYSDREARRLLGTLSSLPPIASKSLNEGSRGEEETPALDNESG